MCWRLGKVFLWEVGLLWWTAGGSASDGWTQKVFIRIVAVFSRDSQLFYNDQDFSMWRRSWSDLSGMGAGNIAVQTSTGVGRVFATSDPAIFHMLWTRAFLVREFYSIVDTNYPPLRRTPGPSYFTQTAPIRQQMDRKPS